MSENLTSELTENLIEFCESRKSVYALLSRCYEKELDAAFASDFAAAPALISDDKALAEGFALLQSDLSNCGEDDLERFAVSFNRVFFGMGPRTAQKAFPYESVYTSSSGLMMQDAYAQVRTLYHAMRFAKNPDFPEPEDHLAVELAFMARLCDVAVDALREGDAAAAETALSAQLSFLRDHLLNWIDRFVVDAKKADDGGFYGDLAAFTQAYLEADVDAVAEVVE